MSESLLPPSSLVRLDSHPIARSKAVANSHISAGSIILATPSLSTVLLPDQKGLRCDTCHRLAAKGQRLRKCTGCASYWYCDETCQSSQWKTHHKRICKLYNQFTTSNAYQALAIHEKLDSLLLSHLLMQTLPTGVLPATDNVLSPISIFLSLLPGQDQSVSGPPVLYQTTPTLQGFINSLYSRFGNNNFSMHSHLTTFGHGIFPLASRLFNHACVPNAAAKYKLSRSEPVTMEVVALRDIVEGEEICLPYLDPALLQTRQQIFEITYGFKCTCPSCQCLNSVGRVPKPPADSTARLAIDRALREFVGLTHPIGPLLPSKPIDAVPRSLICILHESYLGQLSETFSKSSHEGKFEDADEAGLTILALYTIIYPPNYPQIGMHLLEMAKTAWNAIVSQGVSGSAETPMLEQVRNLLALACEVLMILGPEGDDQGPMQEVQTLQEMLQSDH